MKTDSINALDVCDALLLQELQAIFPPLDGSITGRGEELACTPQNNLVDARRVLHQTNQSIGLEGMCNQYHAVAVLHLPVLALLLQEEWKPFWFFASVVRGYSRNSAETYLLRYGCTAGHDLTESSRASSFT